MPDPGGCYGLVLRPSQGGPRKRVGALRLQLDRGNHELRLEAPLSLKEGIEKLIRAERKKRKEKDSDHNFQRHHERQHLRFGPVRTLLQELSEFLGPRYIRLELQDTKGWMELGSECTDDASFKRNARWRIEPCWSFKWASSALVEIHYYEEPGFLVEEANFDEHAFGGLGGYVPKRTDVFQDVPKLERYLLAKVGRHVAMHDHYTAKARRKDPQ
ncbi:MAG TPA: hypothetical protein VLM91_05010 [Candidatus Methylomirabilis sp.]|nr:hypothetical protein [Candidatus Methylomirabilis sp.]